MNPTRQAIEALEDASQWLFGNRRECISETANELSDKINAALQALRSSEVDAPEAKGLPKSRAEFAIQIADQITAYHKLDRLGGWYKDEITLVDLAAELRSRLSALEGGSDYDRAIRALAPYLPDGWVAQDQSGWIYFHSAKPSHDSVQGEGFWTSESDKQFAVNESFRVPKCFNWFESIRRIASGKVVEETKGLPHAE